MPKILVAEDEKFLASAYRVKLEKEGFEVVLVSNGTRAIEELKKSLPDLLLLDLIMPEKTGFEVLEKAQKIPHFKEVPIIVASNLGQQEDVEKAMKLGASDYVIKSNLSMEDLIKKINSLLNNGL